MSASEIVNKVWNYAHVLRDDLSACNAQADGVGYGDYVEQITYLIFLKMADEREQAEWRIKAIPGFYKLQYIQCAIVHMLCELRCLQCSSKCNHKSDLYGCVI